jgi:hypothetical protein
MMQSWIGERMVEEHRRDLAASTRTGIGGDAERDDPALMAEAVTALGDQVAARESWKSGAARRPLAPSVGALLIRMGTRLGGTTMRTS